jgi:predicted exporter
VSGRVVLALWLALLALCLAILVRAQYSADLAAFLPRSPTAQQQMLVDQLERGVAARIILIGIEGADEESLARLSTRLAEQLRKDAAFVSAANGSQALLAADAELVMTHRYLLSPAVTPERFSVSGLRLALEKQLDRLSSPLSTLVTRTLPRDPTGELFEILDVLSEHEGPEQRMGVWFSQDGRRALLIAQTRAAGFDLDAQELALAKIAIQFDLAKREENATAAALTLTGPGVFAVQTRGAIKADVARISALATLSIAALLFFFFRSARVLALIFVPVVTGALVGMAAVIAVFGGIHGITLGFGATLLGEAVDYAIYFFAGARPPVTPRHALERIWPTLRLGAMTSVTGFGVLIFSGFPGLAQLGLFSAAGLVAALLATRWVLPVLAPSRAESAGPLASRLRPVLLREAERLRRSRAAVWILMALSAAWLVIQGGSVWNDEMAALSPVPRSAQQLDESMRRDVGAPDVRHLVVVTAQDEQSALQAAEAVAQRLSAVVRTGALGGFESPADYYPSRNVQDARLAALPDAAMLRENLRKALQGLPFRRGIFQPFLADVEACKRGPPITRADLRGSGLGIKVDSLLVQSGSQWHALLPLTDVQNASPIGEALSGSGAVLLDLKKEVDLLYSGYRSRVLGFAVLGTVGIVVLLLAVLRSLRRTWNVVAPLAAAILVTCAVLTALNVQLTIFHLVAFMLVAGVGSNYTLFFDRPAAQGDDAGRIALSLLLCNLSTVLGFGALAFATTPVLSAIGSTVALGAGLSLIFGAMMSAPDGAVTSRA